MPCGAGVCGSLGCRLVVGVIIGGVKPVGRSVFIIRPPSMLVGPAP